jgi:hypothetical protein
MDPSLDKMARGQGYLMADDESELEQCEEESQEDPLVLRRRSSVHALHPRRMSAVHLQEERGGTTRETHLPLIDPAGQLNDFSKATEGNFDIFSFDTERSELIPLMNQLVNRHIEQGSTEMDKDLEKQTTAKSEPILNGPGNVSHEALQHLIQLAQRVPRIANNAEQNSSFKGSNHDFNDAAWSAAEEESATKKENPFVLKAEQEDATPVLDRTFLKNRSKKLLAKLNKQKLQV